MRLAVEPGRSLARLQNGTQARHHVRDLVADPESVRRLLHGSVPRAVLRRELSALLVDGAKLGPCRLTNAKFKSGRVEAHLDLFIQRRSEPGFVVCPCQVSWEVKGAPTRFEVPVELSGGVPPEIPSRFRSLEAEVTAEAMRIEVSPFDPKHRSFWQLFEPGYPLAALAAVPGVARPASGGYTMRTRRYLPGRSHVVRCEPIIGGDVVHAKVRRTRGGLQSRRFEEVVERLPASAGLGLHLVRRLARMPDQAIDLYPEAAGRSLTQLVRLQRPSLSGHLVRLGCELRRLHDAASSLASELPESNFEDELRATARETEHLRSLMPHTARGIDELLARACEVHACLPPEPRTVSHGDFKVEHVWVRPDGSFSVIDFDKAVASVPAMDLGKFLADLRWWHAVCAFRGLEDAQRRFLEGYGIGPDPMREVSARVYEAVMVVRIALRRVRLVDENWLGRLHQFIGCAEVMLEEARRVLAPTVH